MFKDRQNFENFDDLSEAMFDYFRPKDSDPKKGQIDTTALKFILNNCRVFQGWYQEDGSGFLQSFFDLGKTRNEIQHDPKQKITDERKNTIEQEIFKFFKDLTDMRTEYAEEAFNVIDFSEKEVRKIISSRFSYNRVFDYLTDENV